MAAHQSAGKHSSRSTDTRSRWTDATVPRTNRLIEEREQHRRNRRSTDADRIRDQLAAQSRALLLSSFFWTLGEADRGRLRRTIASCSTMTTPLPTVW
jgi:hypothetical protein